MSDSLNLGETLGAPTQRRAGRRAVAQAAQVAPSRAEVVALKESWCEGVSGESFRRWVEDSPEQIFLNFVGNAESDFTKETLRVALKAVHSLRSGQRRYEVAVTMDELLASRAYQDLSDAQQWAARWCVENQKQTKEKS